MIKNKNSWLEDSEYIQNSTFEDKYYFETLCKHISNYVKNVPMPVVTSYDSVNKRIYFTVGNISKSWEIDIDVSYRDYITIVNRWLYQFFPQYVIEIEKEVSLTEEEIAHLRDDAIKNNEKFNINDALEMKKSVLVTESGAIEKITLTSDEFIFNKGDIKYVMMSGTKYDILPLSKFLKTVRTLETDLEKRNYIINYSTTVKRMGNLLHKISIAYQGKQMINFFIINYFDLHLDELIRIEPLQYKWGNFVIKFESETLRLDCVKCYEEMKFKESQKTLV